MKVGIVGFAGAGKSTVFQWLTGVKPDPAKALAGQLGVARVPDARLDLLSERFDPKKTTYGTLDFLDTPGLIYPDERKDNARRLGVLRESGGLLVVLNGYSESDLVAQLHRFRQECIFADLEIITNRIGKLEDQVKKPRPAKERDKDQAELDLLRRIYAGFEAEQSPASLGLRPDEEKLIRSFQLLTLKPELALVNIGDAAVAQSLPADLLAVVPNAIKAPARLEMELAELSAEDREMFMQDMGVSGFVRDEVLREIYYGMNQIVFFTVGPDECRAWPLPTGADGVAAAGQIHTDLAKSMVRAEVLHYEDFVRLYANTSGRVAEKMPEARAAGVLRVEARTYVVKDGDIVHII